MRRPEVRPSQARDSDRQRGGLAAPNARPRSLPLHKCHNRLPLDSLQASIDMKLLLPATVLGLLLLGGRAQVGDRPWSAAPPADYQLDQVRQRILCSNGVAAPHACCRCSRPPCPQHNSPRWTRSTPSASRTHAARGARSKRTSATSSARPLQRARRGSAARSSGPPSRRGNVSTTRGQTSQKRGATARPRTSAGRRVKDGQRHPSWDECLNEWYLFTVS
jgi:hypothetical protein